MPETKVKAFDTVINTGVRLRRRMEIRSGRVTDFAVALECEIEGQWYAVVRYDTTGGTPHRDKLKPDVTYLTHREPVKLSLSLDDALTTACKNLIGNHERYVAGLTHIEMGCCSNLR